MVKRARFTLSFAPQAIEHLDLIASKYHGLLRRSITEPCPRTKDSDRVKSQNQTLELTPRGREWRRRSSRIIANAAESPWSEQRD
jgi:hypothetical protein